MARASLVMVVVLLVQFILGMTTNLFVTIPAHHPGADPKEYFSGAGRSVGWAMTSGLFPLAAHVILGLVLIVVGFALIAWAASSGRRGVVIASALGALCILGAAFNGASFLNFNKDLSSMIMALLFACATACYVVALYLLYAGGDRPTSAGCEESPGPAPGETVAEVTRPTVEGSPSSTPGVPDLRRHHGRP